MRIRASTKFIALLAALLLVAACTGPTDPQPDGQPDPFTFTPVTNAQPNVEYTSNEVELSGFSDTLPASATGGTLIVNGDAVTENRSVSAGDSLAVSVISSAEAGGVATATVTVGEYSTTFRVTTSEDFSILSFGTEDDLTPGTTITLAWSSTGPYDAATLTGAETGAVDPSAIDLATGTATVTLPTGVPSETYTLTLTNSGSGDESSRDFVAEMELWVCEAGSDYNLAEYIPDEALRAAIRQALSFLPDQPISCNNVRSLSALTWDLSWNPDGRPAIESLVGLQHAVGLETLHVAYNHISDLRPVANLTNLQVIDFDRNHINDLGPISGLVNLVEIGLWSNGPDPLIIEDGIADITPLGSLESLEVLYLSNNNVDDLSPLASLTNLRVLYALNNRISSIEPLRNLQELRTARLGFQENPPALRVSDLSPLENKPNLAWVELQFIVPLENDQLTVFEDLDSLHIVDLRGVPNIDDLTPLAGAVLPGNDLVDAVHGVNASAASAVPIVYACINPNVSDLTPGVAALEADGVVVAYDGTPECPPLIDPEGLSMTELMFQMLGDNIR